MGSIERIYLAYLTEPREVGVSTKHSPQHLTLMQPFTPNFTMATGAAEEVKTMLEPFEVHVAEQVMFGPNHDIPVRLIEPVDSLRLLHNALVVALEQRDIDLTRIDYIRNSYKPHIAVKPGAPEIAKGQTFLVNHIAVMGKGKNARTVLAKMSLGHSNDQGKF